MATLSYPATEMTSDQDPDGFDRDFPTRIVLDRIGDRWTALIVGRLTDGPRRFGELKRGVGITAKVLTQTLRGLERDGLVERTVYSEVPPRVEYALTALGESLREPLSAVREWAEEHVHEVLAARDRYDEGTSASTARHTR